MQAQKQPPTYRQQLIDGLCASIEDKGYAATTIGDIVAHARVSKRTFYEEFNDKVDCFLAAYRELAAQAMQSIAASIDPDADWERQVEAAVRAYLAALDSRPALTRTFFLEILAAGQRALDLRRQVLLEFAELTRRFADEARRRHPRLKRLSPAMATAITGGINELMLLKMEKGTRANDVAETAVELVRAVVQP
jgi:AcrR family transcriptional regulator